MTKTKIKKPFATLALAALAFMLITTTAFAAWHFLKPSDVADKMKYPALAEAFNSSDALLIDKTQSAGGYDVSLLGVVSGKGLTGLDTDVDTAKSYAVVAIAKQNGTMPNTSDDDYDSTPFFVSPLINGQTPWLYNIASMGGGYSAFVADGIMYRLIECGNLEIFADRGLSLIVSSTDFYSTEAYDYDESTGLVTPNPAFNGVNLVFDLPLDKSNADYEKAQQYLDTLWDTPENSEDSTGEEPIPSADEEFAIDNASESTGKRRIMSYDDYKNWMDQQLAEIQKLVDLGEYSAAAMALDQSDYERNLKEIEKGAELTMIEYDDGTYRISITYPDSGISGDITDNGYIVLND